MDKYIAPPITQMITVNILLKPSLKVIGTDKFKMTFKGQATVVTTQWVSFFVYHEREITDSILLSEICKLEIVT